MRAMQVARPTAAMSARICCPHLTQRPLVQVDIWNSVTLHACPTLRVIHGRADGRQLGATGSAQRSSWRPPVQGKSRRPGAIVGIPRRRRTLGGLTTVPGPGRCRCVAGAPPVIPYDGKLSVTEGDTLRTHSAKSPIHMPTVRTAQRALWCSTALFSEGGCTLNSNTTMIVHNVVFDSVCRTPVPVMISTREQATASHSQAQ
jgi:hypothetical protein